MAAAALDAMGRSAAGQAVPELPPAFGPWSIAREPGFGWPTPFERATSSQREIYRRSDEQVELHFAWYASDSGAAKMTRFEGATLAEFDPTWRLQARHDLHVGALTPPLTVVEREVQSPRIRVLVWQWGLIGGIEASGFVGSKLALARAKLSGKGSNSVGVALVTPIEEGNVAAARARLQALATELRPWLQNPGATKP
jgi:EpsI family protein